MLMIDFIIKRKREGCLSKTNTSTTRTTRAGPAGLFHAGVCVQKDKNTTTLGYTHCTGERGEEEEDKGRKERSSHITRKNVSHDVRLNILGKPRNASNAVRGEHERDLLFKNGVWK